MPQFIESEAKITAGLTFKQFFILVGVGAILFMLSFFLQTWLLIIVGAPLAVVALLVAFLKIDGVPFSKYITNAFGFTLKNRTYIWKKDERDL